MSGFIVKAACRGRRPSQFASFNGIERQDLVNRLLEEREVARFIVAPSGYGKTAIAVEYAETMFSWVHTFFINCQSPCFIRDLDDGSIAEACKSADSQIRLVVFDALPPLDAQRSKLFSHEVNALLSSKCEVIVTCAPASDVLGQYQVDQIRLGPSDLLLSDNELDAARSLSERRKMPSEKLSAAHRVPALVWGEGDKVVSLFLKLSFQEPIPADLLLAMASMYVLGRGTLEDLASFGPIDDDLVEHIRNAYPHLCIDADQGYFDVPFASIDDISDALRTQIDSIVSRSTFAARDELVLAWADALMDKRGDADRACDVVRILCPRSHRGNWIASHADELVRRGCFYSILKAIFVMSTKARDTSAQVKAATSTLEAICRMILGDYPGAVTCANRFAFDGGARFDLRVRCLLVIDRLAVGNAKKQATDRLEALAEALDAKPVSALSLEEGLVRAWRACALRPWPRRWRGRFRARAR